MVSSVPPKQRTVVVTGANVGIGLETAVGLASFGDRVIMACRNQDKAEAAAVEVRRRSYSDAIEIVSLDLASFASVRACAAEIANRAERIDVLVNNAGLVLSERSDTVEGIETTFGVNHVGTMLFTTALRAQLQGARIVNLSSVAHWGAVGGIPLERVVDPPRYHGWSAYARSKLANLLFTVELARRWNDDGIVASAVHPGSVRSGFARDGDTTGVTGYLMASPLSASVMISPQRGADTPVWLATADEPTTRDGLYWYKRKSARTSRAAKDPVGAEKLWDFTERLIAERS